MSEHGIHIEKMPELENPLLIAGFDGWGNALDVSKAMVSYLIRKLKAQHFARINPDPFYRYDETRPLVNIEGGNLRSISPPGGSFYCVRTSGSKERDLVILNANEPNLRWFRFVGELFSLCEKLGVKTIITLGSMYDNVLHSDRIISGIASNEGLLAKLKEKGVIPVNYKGPGGIHSTLHSEGQKRGFQCISLWCHCPYYLQTAIHFGLLSHLGSLLVHLGEFELDTEELEQSWTGLNKQIQELIEQNPDLQAMINELRKAKVRGSWANMKESGEKDPKIIQLKDFMEPR
ncbi:MAG: PAC2 family protein [Thermodesulfobacteriota bacterium]|nr:PAC2 family protein [Thermodesulfobacteriota bacterium]